MSEQIRKVKPRTRRTFPVTVTLTTPKPAKVFTPAERWDRIHNGAAWDQSVTRAGGRG